MHVLIDSRVGADETGKRGLQRISVPIGRRISVRSIPVCAGGAVGGLPAPEVAPIDPRVRG